MKRAIFFVFLLLAKLNVFSQGIEISLPKNSQVQIDQTVNFQWDTDVEAIYYQLDVFDEALNSYSYNVISNDTLIELPYERYTATLIPVYSSGSGSPSQPVEFEILDVLSFSPEIWLNSDSSIVYNGSNQVELWTDISGNNYDLTQTDNTYKPIFVSESTEINNRPTISFDGNDVLNSTSLNLQDVEVFVLVKGNGVNNEVFGFGNGYHVNFVSSRPILYLDASNYRYFQGLQPTGVYQLQNVSWLNGSASDNTTFLRINSTDLAYSSSVAGSGFVLNNLLLGSGNLNGFVSEVLVFNRQLVQDEREAIEQYLYYKYAPPVNLGPNIIQYGFCDTTLYAGERFESYLWSDGSVADSLVISESGTYWVEVTDIFGFTSTDTIEVIFPEPDSPSSQLFCPGDQKTWYTNLGPDYDYLWSDGSTADSLSINSTGDYHVLITDTNGCIFQSDTLFFDVDPFETIVDLGPDSNLCSGNSIGLVAGDTEAVDYLWNTGETDSTIIINLSGTYYLDVINDNGCEATDTIEITIIGDAPTVIPSISSIVCQNEEILYEDQSTTSDGSDIISWDWDFGDGGIATEEAGNYSYANNGAFNLSLTVETSAGCFNDTTISITVNEQPILDFVTVNVCQQTVINFNGGQLTPTPINTWEWNFDDPASGLDNEGTGQNTTHIFESADDYDVELIGTDVNGCKDTIVQTVTIEPAPQVDFSFDEVCEGSLIEFQNLSTIQSPSTINGYNWSFGDGTFSGQVEPQKLYSNYGTYSVTLNATGNNGCTGQLTQPLKIHAYPIVDQNIITSCAGITSTFEDASFVPNGSIAEVYWSLNGASPVNGFSIEEIFENSGTQTIDQTVVSAFGCSSNESYTIQIDDFIQANFEIEPNALLAGYPTSFNNLSVGALTNEWIFDNFGGSNEVSPEFTFPEAAVGEEVTIELKIENGFLCRDSVSLTLPVLSPRTDLALSQLFLQEDNGFYIIGVELDNKGTTPITSADLFLRTPSTDVIKEIWQGELLAGEKEIYIFSASPSMTVPQSQMEQNYVCVEAQIKTPFEFKDEDLSNNDICKAISESSGVLIVPHPNPVENNLNVQLVLPFDEVGTLEIYNAQGQIVAILKKGESFAKGLNSFNLNTELWQSGTYSIVYNGENEQQFAKVIKL